MKTNRKTIVACCVVGLLALGCVLVAVSGTRFKTAQPHATTPEQTVEYLASERFVKMSSDDKRRFIQQIQVADSQTPVLTLLFQPGVSDDQRRRVLENILPVIGPVIDQRIDEFDRLPPAEQTARLDAVIDQMQAARRDNAGIMSSAERLNLVLQYLDPHTRAKIRKHIPALRARMKQRGIPLAYPF